MPPPPPGGGHGGPGGSKRANTGVTDSDKLGRLSELLEMDQDEVTGQATTATDLVKLLQNKGVGLNALRAVLHNGDLIDIAA
jgi:hypothetical protein